MKRPRCDIDEEDGGEAMRKVGFKREKVDFIETTALRQRRNEGYQYFFCDGDGWSRWREFGA